EGRKRHSTGEARMKRGAFVLILLACSAGAATANPPPAVPAFAPADIEFFEKKVRPLLAERCYKCHSTQAKKRPRGLLLDSRANVLKGGDSGPAVVPGSPEKSRLLQAVRYQDEALQMPPTGKLPDAAVAVLEEWIRRGVPYPGPGDGPGKREGINLAEGRKFWSFHPPRVQAPPEVRDRSWPRQRIDAFLLAEMEKHGLSPSPAASRRVLIRRPYLDLTA